MVETNFLPSRRLLQGKVKETFEWKEEENSAKLVLYHNSKQYQLSIMWIVDCGTTQGID